MRKLLLSLTAIVLFGSTSFAQGTEQADGSTLSSILMLEEFFAIFWSLLLIPLQQKNKELRKLLSTLSNDDKD
ncbi:hypothetical protein IDZ49_10655 [Francisella tularensis]|nr:hypothetical protein [Francisella tularensis]